MLEGVREYCDELDVKLVETEQSRLAVKASNEGGFNCTKVDLLDLIAWVKANRPELLE